MPTTPTTDATLYQEVTGAGPLALLVAGTPGDAGPFADLATELGATYTVVTYDRRGTSRSSTPEGWSSTSVAEQADDAAALLAGMTSEPALVFGTSNGAAVALELALRHPARVSTVLVHEMPLLSVLADPAPVGQLLGELIGSAMEAGGPGAALEAFLRFAYGDDVFDGIDEVIRERLLQNAEMVFEVELPAFQAYRPDEDALSALAVPARVLVGEAQAVPFFGEAAGWLASRLGTAVATCPGAHAPHLSHPRELAACIAALDPGR